MPFFYIIKSGTGQIIPIREVVELINQRWLRV